MNLSKILNYPLFLAFVFAVALPVSAATVTKAPLKPAPKPVVKVVPVVVKKVAPKPAPKPVAKPALKPAPKPVVKPTPKKAPSKPHAASMDNPNAGQAWRGLVTGIENPKTFYIKQNYRAKMGELTIKLTPESEILKNNAPVTINDIGGGDLVEVKGTRKGQVITATIVKYINTEFKHN